MRKIRYVLAAVLMAAFSSCEEARGYDDYEPGVTPKLAMNGEWVIDIIDENSGDVLAEHIPHWTYDTSQNDGRMYIDDQQQLYYMKGKVDVNLANLTFLTTTEENLADPGTTFSITDGKILKNAARSPDGNVTDSIYFRGEFSYDPGVFIIFSGHRRTGFLEDEN